MGRYSVEKRKKQKAQERLLDGQAVRNGKAAQRQARNRFVPNPKEWVVENMPKPLGGEVLD
jgi:hypothetical protein